jgi:hypothetical protein
MNARHLLWFSFPRSGSNFLSDILAGIDSVESYREVFQKGGVHAYNSNTPKEHARKTIEAIGRIYGLSVSSIRDQALIDRIRNAPEKFFDNIHRELGVSAETIFSGKVFKGHLSEVKIANDLLPRQDIASLIYIRNPLDTFISEVKLTVSKSAISTDTTNLRPALKLADFLRWRKQRQNWMEFFNANSKYFMGVVHYESITALPDLDAQTKALTKAIVACGIKRDFSFDTSDAKIISKQDTSTLPEDKVSNFGAFIAECAKAGVDPHAEAVTLKVPRLI